MARQRRGGFKPPELRGTLGTLVRTAFQQAGVVKDALERGAREGRSRIDDFRADRRRQEALAELGEVVLELIRKGEIDLGELPEARAIVDHLEEIDAGAADEDLAPSAPRSRKRFDARAAEDDGTVSAIGQRPPRRPGRPTNVWRPPAEPADEPAPAPKAALPRKGGIQFDRDDDDDLADYMHPDDVPPKPDDQ